MTSLATTKSALYAAPPLRTARLRRAARTAAYHTFMIGFGLVMLYPLLWLFAASLKGPAELWTHISSLVPAAPTLDNYVRGWLGFGGVTFGTFYTNSLLYAGLGTVLTVGSSAVAAFGFARIRFTGRQMWFAVMLSTLLLPVQVQIIPQYIVFAKLHWLNTFLPLLLPRVGGQAFFIFLIMQFIRGIPRELDDAAAIDGCGKAGIFLRVILPLITPVLVAGAILSFYFTWGDFLNPLIYLNDPKLYTISVALRAYADPAGATDWGAIFAMSALSLVPVFAIFILFQRYLVEGISTTGLRG
jgi:multiple sugar transport system permease protein